MRGLPLALALTLLALPLAAHGAQAQLPPLPIPLPGGGPGTANVSVRMELQDPGLPLIPTRPYSLTLTIHFQYGPGGTVPPGEGGVAGELCGEVTVPQPPPWAAVRVVPPEVCFLITEARVAGGDTVTNSTIVEINVTTDAPALEPYNFTVVFDSQPSGTIGPGHGEISRVISPGFVGKLEVVVPPNVVVRGGAPQEVPLTVRNLGNGPLEVRFRNATAPQGMRVTLPERFVIPQPGGEALVHLLLQAPWTAPVRGQVSIDGESSHPSRPDMVGDIPRARLDVEGRAAVPGAEAPLLLAMLAGLAVLRRRR